MGDKTALRLNNISLHFERLCEFVSHNFFHVVLIFLDEDAPFMHSLVFASELQGEWSCWPWINLWHCEEARNLNVVECPSCLLLSWGLTVWRMGENCVIWGLYCGIVKYRPKTGKGTRPGRKWTRTWCECNAVLLLVLRTSNSIHYYKLRAEWVGHP